MADSKLNDLTEATSLGTADILYAVTDPAGTPADKKITFNNLANTLGATISYTPSWTNITIGDGSTSGEYVKVGNLVVGYCIFTYGTTSSITGNVNVDLPIAPAAPNPMPIGMITCRDTGITQYSGIIHPISGSTVVLRYFSVTGTEIRQLSVNATSPFTFANGDEILISYSYHT